MIKGRAVSAKDKRLIIERLLAAWLEVPSLRLGQFLVNASGDLGRMELFSREDEALCIVAEALVERLKANSNKKEPK